MSGELLTFDERTAQRRSRGGAYSAAGFGGAATGAIAYGSPDYLSVTPEGTVLGEWADGLSTAQVREVVAADGNVAFTVDAAGRSRLYRDASGALLKGPAAGPLGIPLKWWAAGALLLLVVTR